MCHWRIEIGLCLFNVAQINEYTHWYILAGAYKHATGAAWHADQFRTCTSHCKSGYRDIGGISV